MGGVGEDSKGQASEEVAEVAVEACGGVENGRGPLWVLAIRGAWSVENRKIIVKPKVSFLPIFMMQKQFRTLTVIKSGPLKKP